MRTQPIPHAYRAFFHQVGMDPDAAGSRAKRPPCAAAPRHNSVGNALEDALLIAVVETGVPVWALDARVAEVSSLGIRVSVAGDRLGSSGRLAAVGRPARGRGRAVRSTRRCSASWRRDTSPGPRTEPDRAVRGRRRWGPGDPHRGGAVGVPETFSAGPPKAGWWRLVSWPEPRKEAAMELVEHDIRRRSVSGSVVAHRTGPAGGATLAAGADRQLERELADAFVTTFPMGGLARRPRGSPASRDCSTSASSSACATSSRSGVQSARATIAERADEQAANRVRLERMMLDPGGNRFARDRRPRISASRAAGCGTSGRGSG